MAKRIEAIVESDGMINIEYTGFRGFDCQLEGASLEKAISYYGVSASEINRRFKTEEEIEIEVGEDGQKESHEEDARHRD